MRLKSYWPRDLAEAGLGPVAFRGLASVVILAGPNGGGKSRLLGRLEADAVTAHQLGVRLKSTSEHRDRMKIPEGVNMVNPYEQQVQSLDAELAALMEIAGDTFDTPVRLHLSGGVRMGAHGQYSQENLLTAFDEVSARDLEVAYSNAGRCLAFSANVLFNSKNDEAREDPGFQEKLASVRAFQKLLSEMTGSQLEYNFSGGIAQPVLFGRVFAPDELSAGQRRVVAWAVHLQGQLEADLAGRLVLVDEPELELHPAACVEVLSRLVDILGPSGQLWIATHCPAVVSRFLDTSSLYLVDGGTVEFASTDPGRVMIGLLGGSERRDQLRDFLAESEQVAQLRFAAESLARPGVAEHSVGDKQEGAFVAHLSDVGAGDSAPLRLLDYGAGKCRFAAALAETELAKSVDYIAFDELGLDAHREDALANIRKLDPADAERRWVNDISHLRSSSKKVNWVIMCNFLHEVPYDEWPTHFARAAEVLDENGRLILIEDQEPPVGELPHSKGFLLLTLSEVRRVFGDFDGIEPIGKQGRLTMIEIPRPALANASPNSILQAIKEVKMRSLKALKEPRQSGATGHQAGRRHALYSMLHSNASLVVQE